VIKGLALRPVMPDLAAVLRSLACVAVIAGIAVRWGPPGSVTAAVGAAAIAGATALVDSPRNRVPLVLLVSALTGLAVLLGALSSGYSPVFIGVAGAWCLSASMLWALGGSAGLMGAAAGALLVTAPSVAPTVGSTIGAATLAVAGGLLQAVVIAVWPPQRWRTQRAALITAYRALAADARKLSGGTEVTDFTVDAGPFLALHEAFTVVDGRHPRRPAEYRSWYALPERVAATLTDLAGVPRSDALSRVLAEAADTLAAIADTGRTGRVGTDVAISRFDSVAREVAGPESAVVRRLSIQLHEAAAMRLGDFVPTTPDAVRFRRPELRTSARSAVDLLRSQLDWHSPVLRHAVRLGGAVALGCAIERYAHAGQSHWIPLTVLMVLRPETAHTYTRCVGRVEGTAAGMILASTVLLVLNPGVAVSAGLAVVAIGLAFAVSGFGYVAVSAAVTTAAVFLIDSGRAGPPAAISDPLLATLVGGALAVVAHVVFPDDALTRLAQRAGELLKTEIDYAATVIKAYVHELDSPAEALSAAWQRAFRARAAFEAATGAMRLESRELRHWLRSYRTALNAVTSSCTTLEAHLPVRPAGGDREFVLAVDEYVEALCGDPPTAASPWTVDSAELAAADQRLRDAVPQHGSDDASARVLVAEVATITRSLSAIAVSSGPTSAR
jgi:uncharacterized membrane protein YgaE (UPF0421/DUF939 family)